MIENDKIQYIPPVSEAVSLNCEGMVCLSGEFDGFGMEELWELRRTEHEKGFNDGLRRLSCAGFLQ